MRHPDFVVLTVSWELALRADGYADNTVKAYQNAVHSLGAEVALEIADAMQGKGLGTALLCHQTPCLSAARYKSGSDPRFGLV